VRESPALRMRKYGETEAFPVAFPVPRSVGDVMLWQVAHTGMASTVPSGAVAPPG
jgi:hypothetical protein